MTYTLKQRREIYEIALNYFLLLKEARQYEDYMCPVIAKLSGEPNVYEYLFPEFFDQKPKRPHIESNTYSIWFSETLSGINSRIQALERAIELTYKK